MKTAIKAKIINSISDTLEPYDSHYKGYFLCPICFSLVSTSNLAEISIAHILPEAAGGKITTWLCKKCNNILGTNVDKWFGEYLIAIKSKSIIDPRITTKGFSIDGIKLNGAINKVGTRIDLLIDGRRNSSSTINNIKQSLSVRKENRKLQISIPLLGKKQAINTGFITAAYLYGFSIFGYSWVMQKSFDSVRNAIIDQGKTESENVFVSNIMNDDDSREHYFGLGVLNNTYIPCIKIMSRIVFFTPSYDKECLKNIKEKILEYNVDIKRLSSIPNHIYTNPFIMAVGNKVIIYPDKVKNMIPPSFVMLINENTFKVSLLNKLVNADFEKECRDRGEKIEKYSVDLSYLDKEST